MGDLWDISASLNINIYIYLYIHVLNIVYVLNILNIYKCVKHELKIFNNNIPFYTIHIHVRSVFKVSLFVLAALHLRLLWINSSSYSIFTLTVYGRNKDLHRVLMRVVLKGGRWL